MNLFKLNKTIVYLVIGILILALHNLILEKELLSWIVGLTTLIVSIEGLIYDIVKKKYETDRNHIGTEIFIIVVAILILTVFRHNLDMICVCWAIIAALTSTRSLNKAIHFMVIKKPFITLLLFSVLELSLAILLVTNPDHHVKTHVILLGIDFVVEAISFMVHSFLKRGNMELDEE